MAENRTDVLPSTGRRKLSKREQMIVLVTLMVLTGVLLYQFPYLALVKYAEALKSSINTTDKEIVALNVQIADMKAREADIKAGMKSGIATWESRNDGLPDRNPCAGAQNSGHFC